MDQRSEKFMQKAIALSLKSIAKGGGPFGAIIVRNGVEIASGYNKVTLKNDPTAHAEITVIRRAAKKLKNFNLSGCEIYTSCEPCPMCLSAIYWARIDKIYYANSKSDAKAIEFDDSFIYEQLKLPEEKRTILTTKMFMKEALEAFETWKEKKDKIKY